MLLANLWISMPVEYMIIMSDGIRTFLDIIDESWKFSKILFTFWNLKTTFGWFGTSKSLALSGLYAVFLMYYNQITSCCSGERCGPWASYLNIHMNICIIVLFFFKLTWQMFFKILQQSRIFLSRRNRDVSFTGYSEFMITSSGCNYTNIHMNI